MWAIEPTTHSQSITEHLPERFLAHGSLWSEAGNSPDPDLDALVELLASHVPHTLVRYHLSFGLKRTGHNLT